MFPASLTYLRVQKYSQVKPTVSEISDQKTALVNL